MRHINDAGWDRIHRGFGIQDSHRFSSEGEFWSWAMRQGSSFRLAAYFLVGMLDGCESEFPGFDAIHSDAHPVRMAWALGDSVRTMVAEILASPSVFMR